MIGRKGLFGRGVPAMPGVISGYGGGTFDMDGTQVTPAYSMPQEMGVQDANFGGGGVQQKPRSFWQGGDKFTVRDGIAGALAAIGDGLSGWAGGGVGAVGGLLQGRMEPQRLAEEQRRRAAELADYRTKLGIQQEFATPEKDAFDRALANAGIDPRSPQGVELYRQRAVTMAQGQPQEPRMLTLPDGRTIFGTMDEIRGVLGGGGAQQGAPSGGMPRVTNRQEYDAIPPGTQYTDPNGKVRTKGGTSGNVGGSFRP